MILHDHFIIVHGVFKGKFQPLFHPELRVIPNGFSRFNPVETAIQSASRAKVRVAARQLRPLYGLLGQSLHCDDLDGSVTGRWGTLAMVKPWDFDRILMAHSQLMTGC